MKKVFSALAVAAVAVSALAIVPALASQTTTGNGAPSGSHYNLNIIGVPKTKTADMTGSNTHVIFVNLNKQGTKVSTNIYLYPGDFQVTDGNGTDGTASFDLPTTTATDYTIWARAVGTPGGSASIYDCVTDSTGAIYCPTEASLTMTRKNGKVDNFQNVTTDLTTFTLPAGSALSLACGGRTSISLFDPCVYGYLWNYDNNGLKVLQVRFYPNN